MNWVRDHANNLPEAPVPDEAYSVEMDELYTFIEGNKQGLHLDLRRPQNRLYSGLESEQEPKRKRISRYVIQGHTRSRLL
jgi:hypothetical protein